jgi:uncharacterized protein
MPTILISGGTSGLGLALCQKFLEEGFEVFTFSNDQKKVEENPKIIDNPKFRCFYGDVSDYNSLQKIINEIPEIDVVINNAGIWLEGSLIDLNYQEIQKVININLTGQIFLTQLVLEKMLIQNSGIIFNINSTCGVFAKPKQSIYCAAKFGLQGFTESLKLELKNTQIKVFGFYPSGIQTELFDNSGSDRDTKKYMKPKDLADLTFFLIQNSDKYKVDHLVINRNN